MAARGEAAPPPAAAQEENGKEIIINKRYRKQMKKALPWIAVLLVLAIVVFWGVGRYNGMVGAEESVETAWSQVENK